MLSKALVSGAYQKKLEELARQPEVEIGRVDADERIDAGGEDAPTILDRYANTSSAGSVIAFHLHSDDMKAGDRGVLCSFGAGYSAGTVFVEKRA